MPPEPDIEETFVQLVVSHQPALQAFILSMLPGHPEADDVVQEVNSAVWKKRSEFKIGTNFKAWMFSVAKFKVLALWRDQKRRKVWAVPEETLTKLLDSAETSCVEAGHPKYEALRVCLQQLRPEDRALVIRRYFDECSLRTLAAEIGRTSENLKGTMHRIRLSLRNCVRSKLNIGEAMS